MVDGVYINGVDLIRFNGHERIIDFNVMLRPHKVLDAVQQRMAELLWHSRIAKATA